MVGGYTEELKNHKTVKIVGWALAQDNTVCMVCAHCTYTFVCDAIFPYWILQAKHLCSTLKRVEQRKQDRKAAVTINATGT